MSKVTETIMFNPTQGRVGKGKKPKSKKKKKAGKKTKRGIKAKFGKPAYSYLASINPYLNTILNPFGVNGVRIPDMVTFPSVTFQTIDRVTTAVTAGGTFGVAIQFGTPSAAIQLNTGASTSVALTWAAGTALSGYTTMNATYDRVRIVSAGVAIKYMGTPLSAQGRVLCNFVPGNTGAVLPGTSVNAILARPYVETVIAAKAYAQVVYFPLDPSCFNYQAPSASWACGYGILVGDGMTAAATVEATIVINWEATPQLGTLSFLQPMPSRSDPLEFAHANNIITNTMPVVQPPKDVRPADNVAASGNMALGDEKSPHSLMQRENGGFLNQVLNMAFGAGPGDSDAQGGLKPILDSMAKIAPAIAGFL